MYCKSAVVAAAAGRRRLAAIPATAYRRLTRSIRLAVNGWRAGLIGPRNGRWRQL
jgi:hypothetical protein